MNRKLILLLTFIAASLIGLLPSAFAKVSSLKPKMVFEGDTVVVKGSNFDSKTNPLTIKLVTGLGAEFGTITEFTKMEGGFRFKAPTVDSTRTLLARISGGNVNGSTPNDLPLVIFDIPDPDNADPNSPDNQLEIGTLITDKVTLGGTYSINSDNDGNLQWNGYDVISKEGAISTERFNLNGIALATDKNGALTWNSYRIATSTGALSAASITSVANKSGSLTINGTGAVALIANGATTLTLPKSGYIPSVLRAEFDFAIDGGVTGSRNMRNATLPRNARVVNAWYEVIRNFTSASNSSLIGIGIPTDDVNGILAPIAINNASRPWDQGARMCIQNGSLAHISNRTRDNRIIQLFIQGEALTAGRVVLFAEYVVLP